MENLARDNVDRQRYHNARLLSSTRGVTKSGAGER